MARRPQKAPKAPKRADLDREVTIAFRLPLSLREAFKELTRENESSTAQELRKYIKRYVTHKGQFDMFK